MRSRHWRMVFTNDDVRWGRKVLRLRDENVKPPGHVGLFRRSGDGLNHLVDRIQTIGCTRRNPVGEDRRVRQDLCIVARDQ